MINDSERRKKTALMILQGFVLLRSSMELNVEDEMKNHLKNKFEECSLTDEEFPLSFFDATFNYVNQMIINEEYPKFIRSKEFQEYFSKIGFFLLENEKKEKENKIKEEKKKILKREETELMDEVLDLIFEVAPIEECEKKNNMKTSRRKNYAEKFPFEFVISDKKCKQYFSKFIGSLFLLSETIEMYKNTNLEQTRREIANMIIVTFLMPKSKLECTLNKDIRNDAIKKFQFLEELESPENIFNDLKEKTITLIQIEYPRFFASELFQEYYNQFGFVFDDDLKEEEEKEKLQID
jgi:hypothetical protein